MPYRLGNIDGPYVLVGSSGLNISGFGQDSGGEVYVLGYYGGGIYVLRPVVSGGNFPTRLSDIPALLRAGTGSVLLVDNGGDAERLAAALFAAGRLGAFFGAARRPLPAPVIEAGVPVFRWFEPEDLADVAALQPECEGCAFVPVGLPGEDVPVATARLLEVRARGYRAVVPRFFTPVPNTEEWQRMQKAHPLRPVAADSFDGSHLIFSLPEFGPAAGPELVHLWSRDNDWPRADAARSSSYSFRAVRQVIKGFLASAGRAVPASHAREVMGELLELLGGAGDLEPLSSYPFVGWRGRSLLSWVDEAVERRLRSVDDAPEALRRALQHTALSGGKRIRPILMLAMTSARGVPLDATLGPALALEWLHTASLIQDDLPCMDDEDVRRGVVTAHRLHGEGIALLASDALVALVFQDVAQAARHPAVGAERALALVEQMARAIGPEGLAGGQAEDLRVREGVEVGVRELLEIHRHKTVPLFRLAAGFAVTLADVEEPLAQRLQELLGDLGLAFQVADDLLDAEAPKGKGRPGGSDARNGAPSFATLLGRGEARSYAASLIEPFFELGRRDSSLAALARLARFALERRR